MKTNNNPINLSFPFKIMFKSIQTGGFFIDPGRLFHRE